MRDIGKSLGMVITDSDLFPGDSVKISSIRILDGSSPEEIIADAGSLIIASGSGLSPVFTELMRRNGCAMRRVEDFCCHEGGGLTALIAGEEVLCERGLHAPYGRARAPEARGQAQRLRLRQRRAMRYFQYRVQPR